MPTATYSHDDADLLRQALAAAAELQAENAQLRDQLECYRILHAHDWDHIEAGWKVDDAAELARLRKIQADYLADRFGTERTRTQEPVSV